MAIAGTTESVIEVVLLKQISEIKSIPPLLLDFGAEQSVCGPTVRRAIIWTALQQRSALNVLAACIEP